MRRMLVGALLASVAADYELGDYDLNECASVGSEMITTEAGCNAAKDWVLQNAQAKLKIETDANYPRGCYLHDTSKDHGVFIFNDHPSGKGNALSRTICMLKTDQKAESAETSEKAQVDKKAAVVQLHASHERSSSAMEAHPTKAHGKAADEASADDEESVRHRDRHASRHSKHNSRHRSKHGEEHMQLTDAFGKQYTHKSVKHAASLRGDPSDNQTASHSDAPTKSAAEDNATDTDVQSEYKSVKHLRKHERAADKAAEKAAEEKDDKPSHSSHSSHSKKHEPKTIEVKNDHYHTEDTPAKKHEGKTAHAKSDEKLARKHDRAAERASDKTAEATMEEEPAEVRSADVHDEKPIAPATEKTDKKVHPVRFAIHSHDLTFAASKNGAVWRGKLGGGTTPLLEWTDGDNSSMSLFAEPFRRKDIHEGWVERIIMARNGERVLSVMTRKSAFGSIEVIFDNKEMSHPTPLGATNTYESPTGIKLWTSKRQQKRFMIGDYHADWLTLVAGGMKMVVYSSAAEEIPEGAEASHYMHLNIDVESAVPKDALGFLAELAGVRPLSSMTKMLLETPTKRVAKKKSGGDKRALQAE
jgi:hypothetical protein